MHRKCLSCCVVCDKPVASGHKPEVQKMADERRSRGRVVNEQFERVLVKVECDGCAFHGTLANICDEGLCVGVSESGQMPHRGSQVQGWLHGAGVSEPVSFSGSLIWWAEESVPDGRRTLLGVHFSEECRIPPSLYAPTPA